MKCTRCGYCCVIAPCLASKQDVHGRCIYLQVHKNDTTSCQRMEWDADLRDRFLNNDSCPRGGDFLGMYYEADEANIVAVLFSIKYNNTKMLTKKESNEHLPWYLALIEGKDTNDS